MLLSFLPIYSAPLASPLSRHSYALSISSVAPCSVGCRFLMLSGSSAGKAAALMKPVVANLSEDDIIAISSYLGSLPPR